MPDDDGLPFDLEGLETRVRLQADKAGLDPAWVLYAAETLIGTLQPDTFRLLDKIHRQVRRVDAVNLMVDADAGIRQAITAALIRHLERENAKG